MRLKGVIIFTLGVATGGLVATLYWREKYRQKYSKEADEKIKSMQEYVDKLRDRDKDGSTSAQSRYTATSDLREVEKGEGTKTGTANYISKYTNYSEIYSQMHKAEEKLAESEYPKEEETGDERIERETRMRDRSKEEPTIISSVDYDTQYTWFDKATLLYYVEDDLVATEDYDEPIDDVKLLLGNTLEESNFKNSEDEELFVRNFSRGTDYVVVKVNGSWAN